MKLKQKITSNRKQNVSVNLKFECIAIYILKSSQQKDAKKTLEQLFVKANGFKKLNLRV